MKTDKRFILLERKRGKLKTPPGRLCLVAAGTCGFMTALQVQLPKRREQAESAAFPGLLRDLLACAVPTRCWAGRAPWKSWIALCSASHRLTCWQQKHLQTAQTCLPTCYRESCPQSLLGWSWKTGTLPASFDSWHTCRRDPNPLCHPLDQNNSCLKLVLQETQIRTNFQQPSVKFRKKALYKRQLLINLTICCYSLLLIIAALLLAERSLMLFTPQHWHQRRHQII